MQTPPLVPDSAPFSPEQRAWLNQFFSNVFATGKASGELPGIISPSSIAEFPANVGEDPRRDNEHAVQHAQKLTAQDKTIDDDVEVPWHDPSLTMDQRMKLSEGRPLAKRLMAAMAQMDCGACGYVCETYSKAIATGDEKCLNLCVPGGDETHRQLKAILANEKSLPVASVKGSMPLPKSRSVQPSVGRAMEHGFDRNHPITARFLYAKPLNAPGSQKDTRHVVVKFDAEPPAYRPGDALGIYPTNDPLVVNHLLGTLRLDGLQQVRTSSGQTKTLFGAMVEDCCFRAVSDELAQRLGVAGTDSSTDLWDAFASAKEPIDGPELVSLLQPLRPRLYSISSSPRRYPSEIHLTVGRVEWMKGKRRMLGVASNMLASRLSTRETLRVFVHRPHAFAMPAGADSPLVMIGPGTGIAPFIGFLQDREASGVKAMNWLFFGDQHAATDFLYKDQIQQWVQNGLLSRLDTAFSRDQASKVYVQDRLLQNGRDIYQWLENGAHFYVCGDAKSMAASVHMALQQIIATYANRSFEFAGEVLKRLQKEGRYQRDVY